MTGVDNVCERAAVLDADGSLFYPEICLQRRDLCAGVQALCPGLEVAEWLT